MLKDRNICELKHAKCECKVCLQLKLNPKHETFTAYMEFGADSCFPHGCVRLCRHTVLFFAVIYGSYCGVPLWLRETSGASGSSLMRQ
jgi:hypothetical protein